MAIAADAGKSRHRRRRQAQSYVCDLLRRVSTLEATGTLVAVSDRHRLVVLRGDGSIFASTLLPRWRRRADGISSAVATDAGTDAIAFTATAGNTAYGSVGVETAGCSTRRTKRTWPRSTPPVRDPWN
jgi:hypothetical protein